MNKRAWTVVVIAAVVVGAIFVWSSVVKNRKTNELIATLSSSDDAKILDAMQQLRQRGPAIGPRMVAILNGQDTDAAFRAATLLGMIGYKPAEQDLLRALQSTDVDVRSSAALSLGRLHCASAVQPLGTIAGQMKENVLVRTAAVNALAVLKPQDKTILKTLCDILADHPPVPPPAPKGTPAAAAPAAPAPPPDKTIKLRVAAARALGMIGDGETIAAVRDAADAALEPSAEVRVAAAYGLGDFAQSMAADAQDEALVRGLLTALTDENGDVRIASAYSFANIKLSKTARPQVSDALKKAATDEHFWVRKAAERAMQRLAISAVPAT